MSYFPDLSPYCFFKNQSGPDIVNIGWLDAYHPYRKGETDISLIEKLLRHCKASPVNRTRGLHHCPFCSSYPITMRVGNEDIVLGSAEIRLNGTGNVVFAAPNLICHYMAAHQYHPPDEFMAALASRSE
jgi:hypothetical protein